MIMQLKYLMSVCAVCVGGWGGNGDWIKQVNCSKLWTCLGWLDNLSF